MSDLADSGPEFFAQLSLPPEISLPGSWASVQPQDATIAAQGLASLLGGTPETLPPAGGSTDSVSAKGKETVATAPALCISLAVHDGTFLSPADHLVCLGQEEVGALLAVVHMALTADTKTQPFLIFLGAPSVPWDVEEVPRLSLGVGATLGPHNVVSCPTLSFPMGFCTHWLTRANATASVAVDLLIEGSANTLLALDAFQALKLMIISAAAAPQDDSAWSPCSPRETQRYGQANHPSCLIPRTMQTLQWRDCSSIFRRFRCLQKSRLTAGFCGSPRRHVVGPSVCVSAKDLVRHHSCLLGLDDQSLL